MKILQLAARLPYPLNDGGAIGIFNITKCLAEYGHDVTFVSFPSPVAQETRDAIKEMSRFCTVRLVSRPLPSRGLTLARTLFRGAYPIERRMMPEMFSLLAELLSTDEFDIVHLDHAQVGKYGLWIKQNYKVPVVLREHNFENVIYKRYAQHAARWRERVVAAIHAPRVEHEELRMLAGLDAVVGISFEDVSLMKESVPKARYFIVPAGVDTEYFVPASTDSAKSDQILWVGGLEWDPNRDAIEYFLNQIFPLILQGSPSVRLDIVGSMTERLVDAVKQFGSAVSVHGRVADVRPFLRAASVLVVPLRIGGGMRVKLLEFFAAGGAVVATSIGAEGNEGKDEVHLLIRDEPSSFASAVVDLLNDPEKRLALGANARRLVLDRYTWRDVGAMLSGIYEEVVGNSSVDT